MRQEVKTGKRNRLPGEAQVARKIRQARAERHNRIFAAVKKISQDGDQWMLLDGVLIQLTLDPNVELNEYCYMAIVRTKHFGLQIAQVTTKGVGYAILPRVKDHPKIGIRRGFEVCYIRRVDTAGDKWDQWNSLTKREIESPTPELLDQPNPLE